MNSRAEPVVHGNADCGESHQGAGTSGGRGITPDEASEFDAFFNVEQRDLLRFCWGLTVDPDDAHDVAQEAMTRAYEKWNVIGVGNPAGWVRTVAFNLVRNGWRSSQRREVALDRLQASSATSAPSASSSSEAISAEVVAALRSLTSRQREALVLHHMADWSVADVADAMVISEATVKTHLQRGRALLAALLDQSEADGDVAVHGNGGTNEGDDNG